jgi:hypothetical protein
MKTRKTPTAVTALLPAVFLCLALAACPTGTNPDSKGKSVTAITVSAPPSKVTYNKGEIFSAAGLEVTASYDDDSTAAVTGYTLSWNNAALAESSVAITADPGTKEITVTYEDKTTTFTIAVRDPSLPAAATPAASPPPSEYDTAPTITLSTTTEGAAIHYTTDGTEPTTASVVYAAPFVLSPFPGTVKALAVKEGMNDSDVLIAEYGLPAVATPAASPPPSEYDTAPTITLSTTTEGAAIHYTTDGSDPTATSAVYSAPFVLSPFPGTVKAIAVKEGMRDSNILTAAYTRFNADVTVDSANIASLAALLAAVPGGAGADSPIGVAAALPLTDANWTAILEALKSAEKYVSLNLFSCTAGDHTTGRGLSSDGTFASPWSSSSPATGERYIVSLTLPSVATTLGTVYHFTSLKSISGGGVVNINAQVFRDSSLETVNFPAVTSIDHGAFWYSKSLISVSFPMVTDIGHSAFETCTSLVTVNLPQATSIGHNAFAGCVSLTSVNLPMMTDIAAGIFIGCTSLTSINLPSASVTTIGEHAFEDCTSLVSISFPAVTSIGYDAFLGCTSLTAVNLPSVTSFGITNKYPSSGSWAFSGCTSLTSVSLPAATSIESYIFSGCTALTTLDLPLVTDIGNNAFDGCTSLTSVSFPLVTDIYDYTFRGCTSLTSVSLPAATSIGDQSFWYCTALTSVNLPLVSEIGHNAFSGCTALTTVSLPAVETIGAALSNSGLFSGCTALTSVSLPAAKTVGSYTFAGCTSLATVDLPLVVTFGNYVFLGCSALTAVDFPNASSIGGRIFNECTSLVTASLPKAGGIREGAFEGCTALATANLSGATSFDKDVFLNTGTTALTVTLGKAAPRQSTANAAASNTYAKTVTVKAPSDRTEYTASWETAFKKTFGSSATVTVSIVDL